jgi:hypothetical protein
VATPPSQPRPASPRQTASLGPVRAPYAALDLAHEARRALEFRYDGLIPPRVRRAAEARLARRRTLLAKPEGLVQALRADIASLEARVALHRRQLRLDVRSFRRRRRGGLDTGHERLAIEHEKAMLRLLIDKRAQARALLGAARR